MDSADDPGFRHGAELFNQRRYFDAHEAWEDVWRPTHGEPRRFLQGMVQVAVALHHASTGNRVGARSVLARALRNLDPYADAYGGVALSRFRADLAPWLDALRDHTALPAPPRLHWDKAIRDRQ